MKTDLKSFSAIETQKWVEELGLESFRASQIRQWLFKKMVSSFDEMTNISISLRNTLEKNAFISSLEKIDLLVSKDNTEKHLFRLSDGNLIESVLIPEKDHFTLCLSSQAGCAMGCTFCHTASLGFKRNLTPAEIVDQIIEIKRSMENPDRLTNIVMMGMGEPLANYDAVLTALDNMISDEALNFSRRKVTLSTSGLAPLISRLGKESPVNLAVSLNAADDKTRNRLMPVNKRYNLESLMAACREFPLPNRRMITFEYILIKGVNDSFKDAMNLVKLLKGLRAKVNLIPMNPGPDPSMQSPSLNEILKFQEILADNKFTAIIRKSKGQDIMAACGQLAGEKPAEGS